MVKKPVFLLALTIAVALIISILSYSWLQRKASVKQSSLDTQMAVVAAFDLPWGTALKKEMIKKAFFLKGSLPPGYFPEPSSLEGRVLISQVKANEAILESRLAPSSITSGGVAAVIDPKKRAMAVKVDKVIGVSGFINPGNRVDVLVTLAKTGRDSSPITKIILQNIPVLAAGSEMEKKGKDEKPSPVDVITLEVTPEEAEKLALAASEGKIQLALRNFINTEEVLTKGATVPVLIASYSGGKPAANSPVNRSVSPKRIVREKKTPGEIKAPVVTVELIKGSAMSEVRF
jgi:pilus assembly protein CpaB